MYGQFLHFAILNFEFWPSNFQYLISIMPPAETEIAPPTEAMSFLDLYKK